LALATRLWAWSLEMPFCILECRRYSQERTGGYPAQWALTVVLGMMGW
jgi:hypothetical protein